MIERVSSFLDKAVLRETSPEMTVRVAAHDWAKTPLGPISTWTPALRTTVENLLGNGFGLLLWWGPQFAQIYNDAYRPVLGEKHPQALGQPARECWPEIWEMIGPLIEGPYNGGPASVVNNLLLEPNRHGFVEETYFTFAYSPVFDETVPGGIGGVVATVYETTGTVIGERRIRLLSELGTRAAKAQSESDVCAIAADVLESDPRDVPFALLYLLNADRGAATLCARAGIVEGDGIPTTVEVSDDSVWPVSTIMRSARSVVLDDLEARLAAPQGSTAVAVPLRSAGDEDAGFLIVGTSRYLQLNQLYLDFVELLGTPISTALTNARAYEAERKRAEALAELDRAKIDFFSNVSHEFRTPLTLMLGPLEELSKKVPNDQLPLVESARRNSLRLLKLVNTLLQFSRLEAGRNDATFVETDLAAMTTDLTAVFRSAIEGAGLRLLVKTDLRQPVFVDRSMWEKIVLNLLSNALKFTFEGVIRVDLTCRDGRAELSVVDTGEGIPEADLPHVFERFRRVRNVRSRSHEGSGIGLALVDDLVRLHGGTISLESALGEGTAFRVSLPLGSTHLDPAQVSTDKEMTWTSVVEQYFADVDATIGSPATAPAASPPLAPVYRARILLADDNRDLRDYVEHVLAPFHEIVAVRNGSEALEAARGMSFDLLVTDVMMPGMDGFALLKAIRRDESLRTLPVIMLSARAGEESSIEGLRQGANDYLVKPFSAEQLLARVNAQLAIARRQEGSFEREREFRALADMIPAMVWTGDAAGWMDWYNKRWYDYTGQTPAEAAGWGWQAAHHPDDLARVMEEWPNCIATGRPFEMEVRLRRRDGIFHTFLTRALPLSDEYGQITRWYGNNFDIQAQKEAHERTKRVSETLQGVFLPGALPHTPLMRIDAVYQAAEKDALIGGDWFDAVQLPDGRYLLSIGDVAGHGLDASVIGGRLRHAIVDFALESADPTYVLERVNRILRFEHPETYATALVLFVDAACSTLTYASAGHQPPLLAEERTAPAAILPFGGLPLGVEDEIHLVSHSVPIRRDAVLALYTDGIVEFKRKVDEAEERLRSAVAQLVGNTSIARPAIAVRDAVLGGGVTVDDAVVLVAQFSEITAETLAFDPTILEKTWRFHSSDAYSAHRSRHELMKFIRRFTNDPEELCAAELILGELLANTVEHAPGLVEVRIDWSGEQPVVSVYDTGPGLMQFRAGLPNNVMDENGRGLFLVQSLAQDVSINGSSSVGTQMRAVLPLRR